MLKTFTDHDYYCEVWEGNRTSEYDSWEDFKLHEGLDYDLNYNLMFRYDLDHGLDEDGEETNEMVLYLHHALQRHGYEQWHAVIHNISENDLEEINEFLNKCWNHLSKQWKEINNLEFEKDNDGTENVI